MIAPFFKAAAKHRVATLSFIDEFSRSTAAGFGITVGMITLQKLSNVDIDPLQTVTEAAMNSSIAMWVGTIFPAAANFIDYRLRGETPQILDVFEKHDHRPSRLAGWLAGGILSASIAWTTVEHKPLVLSPLLHRAEQIAATLGEATERSFPRLYLVLKNQMN